MLLSRSSVAFVTALLQVCTLTSQTHAEVSLDHTKEHGELQRRKKDLFHDSMMDDDDSTTNQETSERHKRDAEALQYSLDLYHKNATRFQTSKLFVSVGLASTIFHRVGYNIFGVDNRAFRNMAESLSPAVVRVGGSNAGFLIYEGDNVIAPVSKANDVVFMRLMDVTDFWSDPVADKYLHFNVTSAQWKTVHQFFVDVGWKLNFNLNSFLWNYRYEADFRNIEFLLKFCNSSQLPFYGFQFFNEPNSYRIKYDGFNRSVEDLSNDWAGLKELQNQPDYAYFKDVLRVGPDVTSISRHPSSYRYLQDFFEIGGHLNQDVLGIHHYYFDGPAATVDDFMNPVYYDTLGEAVRLARGLCDQFKPEMPVHLSEASDGFGGGNNPLSHSFASTYIYMDMLGQAALYGAEVVNKYTYFSGAYAMVGDFATPRPNYWLALLHKTLIEGPVLVANLSTAHDPYFRTYAHCVREGYRYGANSFTKVGGFVITYINLRDQPVELTLPYQREVHMFKLTGEPGVDDDTMHKTPNIYLNGKKLEMVSECVPSLYGEILDDPTSVTLPRYSVGFIMYPFAYANDCLYNRNPVKEY